MCWRIHCGLTQIGIYVGKGKQVILWDDELRLISFSTGKRCCPRITLGTTMTTMLLVRMVQGVRLGGA
ncbi:putative isoleucine N-monooxygenase [Helianthus anomalus]